MSNTNVIIELLEGTRTLNNLDIIRFYYEAPLAGL
jgi:hypothetical protein